MVLFKLFESQLYLLETVSMNPHRTSGERYIELPRGTYRMFNDLALTFLNHFQLLVRYDVGTKLLSTFRQDKATHISDHIQEYHRQKRLIKANLMPQFLLEWFLKSLLPYITKDVSTSRVMNEEHDIF